MDVVHETFGKVSDRVLQLERFENGFTHRLRALGDLELQLTLEHLLGEQKGLVHLVHELEGRCQQLVTYSMGKFESLVGNLVERSVQERLAHCEADLGKKDLLGKPWVKKCDHWESEWRTWS